MRNDGRNDIWANGRTLAGGFGCGEVNEWVKELVDV